MWYIIQAPQKPGRKNRHGEECEKGRKKPLRGREKIPQNQGETAPAHLENEITSETGNDFFGRHERFKTKTLEKKL
jgi:hypothetical protein